MEQNIQFITRHLASYLRGRIRTVMIDGQSWKYYEQGDGEVMLFLHGIGTNISMWRSFMQGFSSYRRVTPNIPGICMFQYFDRQQHTINQLARWLDGFLEAIDARRVHLVAHSTSCCLGIFYASTRPEKIKDLTLISLPDIVRPGNLDDNPVVQEFFKDIDIKTLEDWNRYFRKVFYAPPAIPKGYQRHNYQVHIDNRERFLQVANECMPSLSAVMTHMHRVQCPVLAINGDHDCYSTPELVNSLDHHFRDVRNVLLKNTGHVSFVENQTQVFNLVQEFLEPENTMATTVA